MFEKSGVGEELRCEFADDGQEAGIDEYPDEEVKEVIADCLLDQEYVLFHVCGQGR